MIRGMKSIIKSTRGLLLLVAASAVLLTLASSCSEVRHMSAEVAYRTEASWAKAPSGTPIVAPSFG